MVSNDVVFFAVHADDCQRAKTFYERTFAWKFQPWGPPGFWLIETSPTAPRGALQQRRAPVQGQGMIGFECTIAVADVAATAAAVEKNGGRVLLKATHIESVGTVIQFADTEGNHVNAMQYDQGVLGGR